MCPHHRSELLNQTAGNTGLDRVRPLSRLNWQDFYRVLAAVGLLAFSFSPALAADIRKSEKTNQQEGISNIFSGVGKSLRYGPKGLQYEPENSQTRLWLGLRFQFRLDDFPGNLVTVDDLAQSKDLKHDLRRGRIKGGGTLWASWLDIYSEYDLVGNKFLDYRVTTTFDDWLDLRIGQWKSEFNRERIDSSGKQQFAERSISTYWFTIDRQRGVSASARLAQGTTQDTHVWLQALSGLGLGSSFESDSGLLLGRFQWNPTGVELPFSQSDLKRRKKALPSVAIAAVYGNSPYTRFSGSGGGSLPGYTVGEYELQQILFETALHYRGLGWQQELHFKKIRDRQNGAEQELWGGYMQLGSFLNEWWQDVPDNLELVGRFAWVDPNMDSSDELQLEWSVGANWFINGHRNKITADLSFLDFEDAYADASSTRFRLQWELSL